MTALLALWAQVPVPLADVAFERRERQIWLTGSLLKTPVYALLDTGAGASTMDDKTGSAAGAIKTRRVTIGGNGPDQVVGWLSRGLDFTLTGASYTTPAFHILPLRKIFAHFPYVPGVILGFDFFKNHVVEIDYAASRLRVYAPEGYRPPSGFEALQIQLIDRTPTTDGLLRLPGQPEKRAIVAFDTGSAFGVDVEARMVRREKYDRAFKNLPNASNTGGLGGAQKTRAIGSADLRLGGLSLSGSARLILSRDPKIRRAFGFDYDVDVTLGDEVLSHYTLIFDYTHSRLYLKPNDAKAD